MKFGKNGDDPTSRGRLSREAAHAVTQEIIRLHARGRSVREIAGALGRPRTSVHRAIQEHHARKLADALAGGEPGDVVAALDDELTAEDVRTVDDVAKLNVLELYRLRHIPELPVDVQAAMWTAWAALPGADRLTRSLTV